MKALFLATALLLTSVAQADYFFCRINVNGKSAEFEAEYRVRTANIALRNYDCSGTLQDNGTVNVCTTSLATGAIFCGHDRLGASIQNQFITEDGIETVICKCGLQ